jgi:hypothetical protein
MNIETCIDACRDAARTCQEALAYVQGDEALAASHMLHAALSDAARSAALSADCLARMPDLHEMILRVWTEISARATRACVAHVNDPKLASWAVTLADLHQICLAELHIGEAERADGADFAALGGITPQAGYSLAH